MTNIKHKLLTVFSFLLLVAGIQFAPNTFAEPSANGNMTASTNTAQAAPTGLHCGAPDQNPVVTSINIGCQGKGNPIADMTFAIIRFLSAGVGLIMVGSIVVAGIQYSASGGDPQATAKAKSRISSTLIALLIFIFSYALLNYLIPGGFFHG